MNQNEQFVVLGVITGAHGVHGAVKIKPFTEHPDGLLAYGPLCDANGNRYDMRITGEAKGQLICAIVNITNRNEAEKIRGLELGVDRSLLPDLDDGEFYINDLMGMQVNTADGAVLGKVKAMHNFGAGDILELQLPEGKTELLPFNEQTFPAIDYDSHTITCNMPEYLQAKP